MIKFIKKNLFIRIAFFLFIGIIIFIHVSKVLVSPASDYRNYQWIRGFYEEPENSLDAVYIGSSAVYSSWLAPWAWERYGIAVYDFASNSQPFVAGKYMIKEARKTQPNAVYILSISVFGTDVTELMIHHLVDYMPASINKFQMTDALLDIGDYAWKDRLEYYIPLIRFHSRWSELQQGDFQYSFNGLKGASTYDAFLSGQIDASNSVRSTTRRGKLNEKLEQSLKETLQYCKDEGVKAIFVTAPALKTSESFYAQVNSINDLVESYGFPSINPHDHMDEVGIDPVRDYYNANHVNIHGSIKMTDYLARCLIEIFDLKDKRGDPAYKSWDEAYEKYLEYSSPNVLDIEWNLSPRDYSIAAPELSKVTVNGTELTVSWKEVPGVDGYAVYKRIEGEGWRLLNYVAPDVKKYIDRDCKVGNRYTYTVIAYKEEDNQRKYGSFDMKGINGTAALPVSKLLELKGDENNLTLTWDGIKNADGYLVLRKLPGKSWSQIADVSSDTYSYTDADMLSDMPYQYTVRPYYLDNSGTRIYGSYDTDGLLYLPEIQSGTAELGIQDGMVALSWDRIEGITGYNISRRTADSDWALIAEQLSPESTEYKDVTAEEGVTYSYQITPFIKYKNEVYEFPMNVSEKWINAQKGKYPDQAPELLYFEQVGEQICLVWEPVTGATVYRIWRRKDEDGSEWAAVKSSVENTVYTDRPEDDGDYEYLIQALYEEDGILHLGGFQEDESVFVTYEGIKE